MVVGHVAPEAQVGGNIALIKDGDLITIDAVKGKLHLDVDDATLEERRAMWAPPAPKYTRGVAAKYVKEVGSSARGAVTD